MSTGLVKTQSNQAAPTDLSVSSRISLLQGYERQTAAYLEGEVRPHELFHDCQGMWRELLIVDKPFMFYYAYCYFRRSVNI